MNNCNKSLSLYFLQFSLVLLGCIYLLLWGQWNLQTNILTLLPQTHNNIELAKAEEVLFKDQEKQVVIAISGNNATKAHQALQRRLRVIESVEFVNMAIPTPKIISQFYRPYKNNFITPRYKDNLDQPAIIRQIITAQLTQITNPFVSETLAISPRLNLADYLNLELNKFSKFESVENIPSLVFQQKRYYFASVEVIVDGFSLQQSQIAANTLMSLFTSLEQEFEVELIFTGILFHTAESSQQAQFEISTFGMLSLVGVMILILFTFRSLWPLSFALLVVAIAIIYGLTALMLFFDELHLLTLVFAVTLIGVVIDYCFHSFVYFNKKAISNEPSNSSIVKPLSLGFATTALGYGALMFSPLSLLSQVAIFMIFGLFGALLCVLMFIPNIRRASQFNISPLALTQTAKLASTFQRVTVNRVAIFMLLTLFVLSSLMIKQLSFNDDIRLLNSSPVWLLKYEQKIAQMMGIENTQRLVIRSNSKQALLEKQEQVIAQLSSNQPDLVVKSIAGLLPSIAKQRQDQQLLKQADEQGSFISGLNVTGLKDPIENFEALTYDKFISGPLRSLASLYLHQDDEKNIYALWLELSGQGLADNSIAWIEQQNEVSVYNKADEISLALQTYRHGVLFLLVVAFIIVGLVLFARYGIKHGVLGVIAITFSALGALIFTQSFMDHLNLFNLLAVVLILALAIDYVIFYQEHGMKQHTLLAIALSAISSILVFGMLAFSSTPAVKSFGLTVMFGIFFIFLLAPLTCKSRLATNPKGN